MPGCEGGGRDDGRDPARDRRGNPYLDVVVRSNLGHARNALVVGSADAVIAIGGKFGTLSEIALALKMKKPVFGVGTWKIEGVFPCAGPEEAVLMAVRASRLSR